LVPPVAVDAARYRQQGQGKRIAIRFLAASPGLEIVTSRQTFVHRRHGVVAVFFEARHLRPLALLQDRQHHAI
jgi:transposase